MTKEVLLRNSRQYSRIRQGPLKKDCRRSRLVGRRLTVEDRGREETGRLQEGSVGVNQPLHSEGDGAGERAGSASPSRRDEGVNIDSLLRTIGEVEVARGSRLALESREISSIKLLFPNWGVV